MENRTSIHKSTITALPLLTGLFFSVIQLLAQPKQVLDAWKSEPRLSSASFGICLAEAKSGQVIYSYQQDLFLIPASTLKLFTTGAAAALLKPNFKFETQFAYTGQLERGVLNGDLVIIGGGDMTLYSEHFDTTNLLKNWVLQIKKSGIKKINGHVIVDNTKWPRRIPDHWIWSDISNYYGAAPVPLSYKDNKFRIWLKSTAEGSPAEIIKTDLPKTYTEMQIECKVIAKGNADQAYVYGNPFGYARWMEGCIPANKSNYDIEAALPDPGLLCAIEIFNALKANEIEITGQPLCESNNGPSIAGKLFSHYSPSLERIIRIANLKSNNLFTEGLVYALGEGNYQRGLASIKDFWAKKGITQKEFVMYDGCGLSRSNLVTATAFRKLLFAVYNDSILSKCILPSLPTSGLDGSMAHVGKGTPLEKNMRAKTGYIEHVRAYAGYLKNKQGKDLLFVILLNNYHCNPAEARLLIEKMMLGFWGQN
jgi:D-alanyl-D-alanine carboxypeptidase/D-alanyl-D-alanine-endopeptidase (penicillin-binding protein 4)